MRVHAVSSSYAKSNGETDEQSATVKTTNGDDACYNRGRQSQACSNSGA